MIFLKLFFVHIMVDFFLQLWLNLSCASGCGSVWLERHLREVEAASSNLVTPTNLTESNTAESKGSAVFLCFRVSDK